ncbi:MAG: ribosome biogenesis GTPase Der, partial [Anaerovoracaceae bacterium]
IANMLRNAKKPVTLVVNKIDSAKLPDSFYEFYELGLGEPLAISSVNLLGLGDLLENALDQIDIERFDEDEDSTKIAIIGKPNVGKSSLVNNLLGIDRVIVSPMAGTTRDSIDTSYERDGKNYTLIDTAGIRRKSKVKENIEYYSVVRAIAAIERSDVCVFMIDAEEGLTDQDKKIVGMAHEAGKGIVVVVNKWDLIKKETNTMRDMRKRIEKELYFMAYAPIEFISAIEGNRMDQLFERVRQVEKARQFRVPTGRLNSLLADAIMMRPPPSDKGKRLKIYYASQIGVAPPLFSFSINKRDLMHFSYARYLENKIREAFGFEGTSIKFVFNEKTKE